ncbi:MAG: hypothetical protein F6K40_25730 [Okeania sp. SIO3I5]|uniref:hypothetical protein n=1 Tax=Okeania sp. SIO3I5 TaxID=2607805 RepID=UPI0013BB9161|nr:hypothetical protein [Okeania sp. SIO3I5]NEQ39472.1 hypothetical protein [Okeania sp. SIO3I5]
MLLENLLFCLIIFIAGLVRGVSGFALGLLGTSLLINLIDFPYSDRPDSFATANCHFYFILLL